MRVLSLGNFSGRGWDGSVTDENHIADALEELGHEVIRIQREEVGQVLIPKEPVDFTLVAQWDGYPDLSFLPRPLVYWAFDYQNDGQEWHERLVKESDLYLSKRIADFKYPNWQYLSQDFAPKFLDKTPNLAVDKDIDVLFTGSYLPWATERNATLKAVDEKFNLVIHSVNAWEGFKDVRPPIMDEGLPGLYARAKVILSIDHTLEAGYWSDRSAQIMACGRRPLVRYIPLMESTFHDKVDYFYSVEDCLEKIEHLINWKGYPSHYPIVMDELSYSFAQTNLKAINRVQDLLTIVRSIL
jgi:hypothetical protein